MGISAQGKGCFFSINRSSSGQCDAPQTVGHWTSCSAGSRTVFPKSSIRTRDRRSGPGIRLPSALGQEENEPQRYQQIGCVMMAHDYLRWCLTA